MLRKKNRGIFQKSLLSPLGIYWEHRTMIWELTLDSECYRKVKRINSCCCFVHRPKMKTTSVIDWFGVSAYCLRLWIFFQLILCVASTAQWFLAAMTPLEIWHCHLTQSEASLSQVLIGISHLGSTLLGISLQAVHHKATSLGDAHHSCTRYVPPIWFALYSARCVC